MPAPPSKRLLHDFTLSQPAKTPSLISGRGHDHFAADTTHSGQRAISCRPYNAFLMPSHAYGRHGSPPRRRRRPHYAELARSIFRHAPHTPISQALPRIKVRGRSLLLHAAFDVSAFAELPPLRPCHYYARYYYYREHAADWRYCSHFSPLSYHFPP